MSAKWRRSRKWDREHLTGPLTPVRWALTALSSIALAVVLLLFVSVYGALASVPLGLFALIPTYLFQGGTYLGVVAALTVVPWWLFRRASRGRLPDGIRFVAGLGLLVGGVVLGSWTWYVGVWPALRWDPGANSGVRFFADFAERYRSMPLRQLPGIEMSEIEFYAWWPFKAVLYLFVLNMVTATVRRIEFRFENIGVLTVHTGIVTLALGSLTYDSAKVEGDMILGRMPADATNPAPYAGRAFYDNMVPALFVRRSSGGPVTNAGSWYMASLRGLPRYNPAPAGSPHAPDIAIHRDPRFQSLFTAELEIEVVGIIPYGERTSDFRDGGEVPNPSIEVRLHDPRNEANAESVGRLLALIPPSSTARRPDFTVQYLGRVGRTRYEQLVRPFPEPGPYLARFRVGMRGEEIVRTVRPGDSFPLEDTGWSARIVEHRAAADSLALVSTGYRGARSARLVVELESPEGETITRHVLHRFPELTQDFLPTPPGEPPRRQAADPRVSVSYIDATTTQIYVIDGEDGDRHRIVVRRPGGAVETFDVATGEVFTASADRVAPLRLSVAEPWPRTTLVTGVRPVPFPEQRSDFRGNWVMGFLDVEIRARQADGTMAVRRQWLPFNQYLEGPFPADAVEIDMPGYGRLVLAFSRLRRPLPDGLRLALADFEMIPYAHSDTPKDYVSTLLVRTAEDESWSERVTRLNRPYVYTAGFSGDAETPVGAVFGRLRSWIVPDQYKFSQAGWDPERQAYTVLGVGNNPGIYVIAFGGILIGAGIPWAFYVKPALLRRRSRRIAARKLAERTAGLDDRAPRGSAASPRPDSVAASEASVSS